MSDVLSAEGVQELLRRLDGGETLSDDEGRALAEFRAEGLRALRVLQAKMQGVSEEEVLEALARDGTITIDARPDLRPPAKLLAGDRRPNLSRLP